MFQSKFLVLTAVSVLSLGLPAYAADEHDHGAEGHAEAASEAHGDGHGHDEKPHFSVTKPATVEAAWAMVDETVLAARQAIKDNNADGLHQAGEKLAAAVAALHDHPQAVKEENGQKLTQALDQLSKTVDRFHHAAEDKNTAGATEALDLFESQKALVQSLYPSIENVEP
ncbi:MAG: hypothetical protein KJ017_05625 [Alphaproteobacteria bacterium]|nr:hypothetical protein [Alphaproteobacteria bacterium]